MTSTNFSTKALMSEECPHPSARPDVVEAMVAALGGRSKDIFRVGQ